MNKEKGCNTLIHSAWIITRFTFSPFLLPEISNKEKHVGSLLNKKSCGLNKGRSCLVRRKVK